MLITTYKLLKFCFFFLQGESILKLAEMCRKLETETEKVLPFYASSLTPEEDDDAAAAMQEAPSEPLAEVKKWSPHHYHLNT